MPSKPVIYLISWTLRLLPIAAVAFVMFQIGRMVGPIGPLHTPTATAALFAAAGVAVVLPFQVLRWKRWKQEWDRISARTKEMQARIDALSIEQAMDAALDAISQSPAVRSVPAEERTIPGVESRPELVEFFRRFQRLGWVLPGTTDERMWLDASVVTAPATAPDQIRVGGFGGKSGLVLVHRRTGRVTIAMQEKKDESLAELNSSGAVASEGTYPSIWHFIVSWTSTIETGRAMAAEKGRSTPS